MVKSLLLTTLIILMGSEISVATADQLILNDGRRISGHILQHDPEAGMLVIAIVEDGKRTGIQEIFFRHEIREMMRNGEYSEAPLKTLKVCYEYGYQWGRCAMAAYFGYRCEEPDKIIVPMQCSDTPPMKRGVRDGIQSVYDDFPDIPDRRKSSAAAQAAQKQTRKER